MSLLQNPNIILVVVDAARQDYFGCYGFPKDTTPNIDKFAHEGFLFKNVISTAPWTIPSHGSIFTSLYPSQHKATWDTLRLKEGLPTIFDIFTDKGYKAVAISANSLIVSPYSMFGRNTEILGAPVNNDSDVSSFSGNFDYRKTDSQSISGHIIRYLEANPLDKPQIIYMNFYDLHAKYKTREPFSSQYINERQSRTLKDTGDFYSLHFQEMNNAIEISEDMISSLRASYAARLAMIDFDLGRVFEKLKQCGILDNCIVVITSDHGDILGDHKKPSFHHQFSIYNSLLSVPLIFYFNGIKHPKEIEAPLIQNTDILPTILQLCGIDKPPSLDNSPGVSLAEYILNNSDDAPRKYAISMYEAPYRFILRNKKKVEPSYIRSLMAIQDADYKLIFSDKDKAELYHIRNDKFEKNNIAADCPRKVAELKGAFYEIIERYKEPSGCPVSLNNGLADEEKIIQKLKALGYIE